MACTTMNKYNALVLCKMNDDEKYFMFSQCNFFLTFRTELDTQTSQYAFVDTHMDSVHLINNHNIYTIYIYIYIYIYIHIS